MFKTHMVTDVVPQILEALPYAICGGLRLPIVCNTSALAHSTACAMWMLACHENPLTLAQREPVSAGCSPS
jgi:hypothetical protein